MSSRSILALPISLIGISVASAQQLAPTTVQLPTFSAFTVSTVVSVPDAGWVHNPYQASYGWTAYGPAWGASSIAWHEVQHTSAWSVGAQVIDLAALDVQTLSTAPVPPAMPDDPFARQIAASRNSSAAFVPGSVADARRARAAELAGEQREIDELIDKAEALVKQGKPNVARIYFQMAANKSSGERKRELENRAASLKQAPRRK